MSLKRRLFNASALSLLDYGLKIGVVLVVSPFLIGRLGKEEYGLWVLLLSVIGYLDLLDLGLSNTAIRYLSRALGSNNDLQFASLFQFFQRLYRVISLAALLLTWISIPMVPMFTSDPATIGKARTVIGVGGSLMSLSFFLRIYPALLKSHVLYHRIILAGIVRLIVYTALMFWVLLRGGGIVWLAGAWAAGVTVELVLIRFQARRLIPSRPASKIPSCEKREMRTFAGKHLLTVIGSFLRERVDAQVLGSHINTVAVTHYSVGSRLIQMFVDVINAIFGGHFLAGFSQIHANEGIEGTAQRLLSTLRFCAPVALLGGTGVFILGPPFIDRWLGTGFEESHQVIYILVPPYTLLLMQYPVGPYLGSMNRHGILAAISLFGGALNLVASLALVRWIGFSGVVIATAVELTLTSLVFWPWVLSNRGGVDLRSYFATLARPLVVITPAAMAAYWIVANWLRPTTYPMLVLGAIVLGTLALPLIWLGLLNSKQRRQLIAH